MVIEKSYKSYLGVTENTAIFNNSPVNQVYLATPNTGETIFNIGTYFVEIEPTVAVTSIMLGKNENDNRNSFHFTTSRELRINSTGASAGGVTAQVELNQKNYIIYKYNVSINAYEVFLGGVKYSFDNLANAGLMDTGGGLRLGIWYPNANNLFPYTGNIQKNYISSLIISDKEALDISNNVSKIENSLNSTNCEIIVYSEFLGEIKVPSNYSYNIATEEVTMLWPDPVYEYLPVFYGKSHKTKASQPFMIYGFDEDGNKIEWQAQKRELSFKMVGDIREINSKRKKSTRFKVKRRPCTVLQHNFPSKKKNK